MLTSVAIRKFMSSRGGLRAKTRQEYFNHLAMFLRSFPGDLPLDPELIQDWLNSQLGQLGQPLAPETVHSRFRTLRAMYRQLKDWDPDLENPMHRVRAPRLLPKAMRAFSDQELYSIFYNKQNTPRDLALLTLLLDVGPRAGECAGLMWRDISPGFITLRGKTGERSVPISEITYRRLLSLRNGSESHVFAGKRGPLTYQGIYKTVRLLCLRAGITGRRASPHTFRHTFGTNYAAADGSDPKVLQDIMGHRDFKTTLRYIQNNPKRMAQNHVRCTPLRIIPGAGQNFMFADVVSQAEAILSENL